MIYILTVSLYVWCWNFGNKEFYFSSNEIQNGDGIQRGKMISEISKADIFFCVEKNSLPYLEFNAEWNEESNELYKIGLRPSTGFYKNVYDPEGNYDE